MKLFTLLMVAALSATSIVSAADEINVYSARKENLIKPILDTFTEKTGIQVNLLTGKADALLKRMEAEGVNTPADMLITVDAGRLHRARTMGLLQAIESETLSAVVPSHLRDRDGYWYGLSQRSRPIMYVTKRVQPNELSSYEDLADPRWKGKICIRSSSNIYNQSLVASMISAEGEEKTQQWANGLVANFARPPSGGDRDQIKAAAAGLCDVIVVNTYYLGKMLEGKDKKQHNAAQQLTIFWPNQDGRGVHVNVSGAGITKHAKNKDNAIKLLEHLISTESQTWYAKVNIEYPVREDVEPSDLLKAWGEFKADQVNLTLLGENNPAAVKIMDRAGWK